MKRILASLAALLALTAVPRAQEFTVFAGAMRSPVSVAQSYSWQLEFRQPFARHAAWSLSWLNEGHIYGHHRDGWAAQAWSRLLEGENFSFALGLGAYRYFDTQHAAHGDSVNIHGWAPLVSLEATYRTASPWFFRLRANRAAPRDEILVDTLTLGVGYRFGEQPLATPTARGAAHEFTVYGGRTFANTRLSRRGLAASLEYRRDLARGLEWTLAWLDEGDPDVIRRHGVATQVWLAGRYLEDRLALGFGFGAYAYVDRRRPGHTSHVDLATLVSPSVAYRFSRSWMARFTWHRVSTDYARDADVFLLGFGYRRER